MKILLWKNNMMWNKNDDLSGKKLRILTIGNKPVTKSGCHNGVVIRQFIGCLGLPTKDDNTLIRFKWNDFGVNELILTEIEYQLF